jgi:flagellar operon protein
MSNGAFIYPNVTSLPGQTGITPAERGPKKQEGVKGEFDKAFEQALEKTGTNEGRDLNQVKSPLKFSAHASQRMQDRKISIDQATMTKVNDAVDKAESKGLEDTLILTKDAAFIVNVKNRTVITALDKNNLSGNVFTNIDGAVIV